VALLIGGSLALAFLIVTGNRGIFVVEKPKSPFRDVAGSIRTESIENLPKNKSANATEKVAWNIAEKLGGEKNIAEAEPEKIAEEIFADNLRNLDLSAFQPEIKADEIRVVKSADQVVAENYFKNLVAISKNNHSEIGEYLSQNSKKGFQKIASVYAKSIAQIYQLVVPESLLAFHREELRLLEMRKAAFEGLAAYESDPLHALASAQLIPEIDAQFAKLIEDEVGYINRHRLNL